MVKMKAYRLINWEEKPQKVEVDIPVPEHGEVLVKVAGNGLCHSDIGMQQMPASVGEQIGWHMPFTLGHEIGGYIESTGEGVTGYQKGDPIVLTSSNFCGECEYCLKGLTNSCDYGAAGRGYGRDGGLANYVLVTNPKQIIKLNELDPVKASPLTDAGATAYHAVKRVLPYLVPGSTVAVIGAGGLGSYAIQFLNVLTTAKIIAVDMNESRLDIAKQLGADATIVGVDNDTEATIKDLTNNRGVEVVLDFAGFDSTIEFALKVVRKCGAFGLIGAGQGKIDTPWYGSFPLDAEIFNFQGGSLSDVKEVIALAENGDIQVNVDKYAFDEIEQAYEDMENGRLKGRAVIVFE